MGSDECHGRTLGRGELSIKRTRRSQDYWARVQGTLLQGSSAAIINFQGHRVLLSIKKGSRMIPRALWIGGKFTLPVSVCLAPQIMRSQGQIVWFDCRTRRSILSARIGVSRVGPGFGGWQVPPGPSLHRIQYLQPATGRGAHSFWGNLQGTRERKKGTDGDGKTNVGPVSVP